LPETSSNAVAKWLLAVLVFLTAMWLYTTTATPGLIVGGGIESESAQLQRVANRLGIAHSTGYPLHTIIGYGAARLAEVFDADPYTWITYTSAVASGVALVLFFLLLLEVASPPAALAGTGLLMVTNTFWHISTITETQALHAVSVLGLWWLTLVHFKNPKRFAPLVGMALLAGIGLANHRTIIFSIGAVGLAVLLSGGWRKWSWRQWIILLIVFILPVLSYVYLYWRADDPNVVFSTRITWFPSELDNGDVTDIIRGTLQSGEGLEGNLVLPEDDVADRWQFVVKNLDNELTRLGIWLGVVGLGLLAFRYWRLAIVFTFYFTAWIIFLMSWRLDWKAVIYYHTVVAVLIMGLGVLASFPLYWKRVPKSRVLLAVLALPLFGVALANYFENRPLEDRSDDRRGIDMYGELAYLYDEELIFLFTGGWMPDTFIALEYIDDSGRRDIWPQDTLNAQVVADAAFEGERAIYISPALRGFFGLYSQSTFFRDRGLAFSGTESPLFFELRPWDDPELETSANGATVVDVEIAPEINLYSYDTEFQGERLALTLFWRATEAPPNAYAVFTHLRAYGTACDDSTLRGLVAQDDSSGTVRNIHPTNWWQAGEIVKDTYFMQWDESALPMEASLVIGMTLDGQPVGEYCLPVADILEMD
jgi:hypothetical protein